jgi:type I restriction enzyme, S subunit
MSDAIIGNGWTRIAFGDVVRVSQERSSNPDHDGLERYVGLEHLEPGDLKIRRWGNIADGTTFTTVFRPGQVLFGKRRAYQRKVAVADFNGVCSGDIYVLEAKNTQLLSELLPFICQSDGFFEHAVGTSAGSLSPRTNWDSLASYEFAMPPLDDQRRLAKALHALEQSLEAARAAMNRGSILVHSILREELPTATGGVDRWPMGQLADIADVIDPNPSHRYPDYVEDGIPFIATQDFVGNAEFRYDQCKHVSGAVFEEQRARCGFDPQDIVFARKGILGLARPYGDIAKAFSHTIVILKAKRAVADPNFLLWMVRSEAFMIQIQRFMNSNSGVPTLGVKTLQGLAVWKPSLDHQRRIANVVSSVEMGRLSLLERFAALSMLKWKALTRLIASPEVTK